MTKYAKRRADLNKQTVEQSETLTGVRDFIVQKSEVAQNKVQRLMRARGAMNTISSMKTKFQDDFVTL